MLDRRTRGRHSRLMRWGSLACSKVARQTRRPRQAWPVRRSSISTSVRPFGLVSRRPRQQDDRSAHGRGRSARRLWRAGSYLTADQRSTLCLTCGAVSAAESCPTPAQNDPAMTPLLVNRFQDGPQLLQTLARGRATGPWAVGPAVQRGQAVGDGSGRARPGELRDGLRLHGTREQPRRNVEGRNVCSSTAESRLTNHS